MSRKIVSRMTIFTTCLIVGTISFTVSSNATTFSFEWHAVDSGHVTVKANQGNLGTAYYGANFQAGLKKWNDSAADITIWSSGSVESDIDLYSVSGTTWTNNGWGSGEAWAQPWSETTACATTPVFTDPDDNCAGDIVDYGAVYTNNSNTSTSTTRKQAVIAHEIGHIIGLDHTAFITAKDNSIMTSNLKGGYEVTDYDVSELNGKY
ncbi:matrixin family metalloprotease [Paenibacillus harenae]|uniref:Peptidase M10 metallopeptidase domain-containing protein n=1 Tax=Paenibacillus harenae TaxID=306543 RepID=A0ABT9U3W1_PAEHA|nr:matrixin family metalloprotease [Paenibacillus harenae]MDQ0114336.1 hypothetical protein [Paenibacillus harenae]